MKKYFTAGALALLAVFIFACAATAQNRGNNDGAMPKESRGADKNAGPRSDELENGKLKPPPDAPGLMVTLRGKRSKTGTSAFVSVIMRNTTTEPFAIKNEFMSTIQKYTSFVRVFLDQKESTGAEMFRKKSVLKQPVIYLKPGKDVEVLEIEFYNLPQGGHTVYLSYSSQIHNYERKQNPWWLGTTTSNMVSIRVAQGDIDAKITTTGNSMMKKIVSDLKTMAKTHPELKGIGTGALRGGEGLYPQISQVVFNGSKGFQLIVQLRGSDEKIKPVPDFETKFPYLGITVVCWVRVTNNPVLRNDVFETIRDNTSSVNKLTKSISSKKAMDVAAVSENLINVIETSDMIVQGTVTDARTEVQDNLSQQWVLSVKPVKVLKGKTRQQQLTVYTDSPTVRFKGSFVGKQFLIFLDLKYRNPVTYTMLAAEKLNPDTIALIQQKLEKKESK